MTRNPSQPSTDSLSLRAPAKVNLTLRIQGRLPNDYHALTSLIAFANYSDQLTLTAADSSALVMQPRGAIADADNLVARAHAALEESVKRRLPAHIELQKNIPVAAGLGGGSADAAACLRGLCQMFDLDISPAALHDIALSLGADVPVCLSTAPQWMSGIGDELTPIADLPKADILLVNPNISLPTSHVFAVLNADPISAPPQSPIPSFADITELADYIKLEGNDLMLPARGLLPEINHCLLALAALPDVLAVSMSGSGASCFALLPEGGAQMAHASYLAVRPNDWCAPTRLIGAGDAKIN